MHSCSQNIYLQKLSKICYRLVTRQKDHVQTEDNDSIYLMDCKYISFHYYTDLRHKSKEHCEYLLAER